jgi:hypothetical protein
VRSAGLISLAALSHLVQMLQLCFNGTLQRVLLCGWGETQFMADLLAELDHGPSALPPGSSVTLLNSRPTAHIMSALI